ncbi:intersectin-2 isoform X3 [Fopius arisanus]|uniref:Intersectin-2 isoform X3 n=1 Tax=Fopius arisanus TaxID=64838 RepID=A0A9R1U2H1_9HYME|nr:PREDICTED: intersectin-2 isoform X3 [Fopius arisanus]
MAMPQAGGMDPWTIQPREKVHYKEQFESLKPVNGVVTGEQAKGFLLRSQLPPPILGQIWALSDTDADGKMDVNEFSIACKLIHLKLRGLEVPQTLPPTLVQSLQSPIAAPQTVSNGGFQNVSSLVNLGGAPAQPVMTAPGRPVVPPMQAPLGSRQFSGASGTLPTNNPAKPPARPAPPFMGNVSTAVSPVPGPPQRPAPPVNIGAGFNATTGILPPPKPAPPSFPNSPVASAAPVVQPQVVSGIQQMPMGVPVVPVVPVVPMPGGAPIAPLNTTPAPIQAFGMGQMIPSVSGVPLVPGMMPSVPSNGISAIHQPSVVPAAMAGVMGTPVSTNTPLSTTARPPSIDRVGSIDSQHSQQSQHSQHSQQSVTSPPTVEWSVPHQTKLKYTQIFNTCDRTRTGFLSGPQARNIMVQTQLPQNILAKIWGLSDMDSDGRLGCEEFVLAMHLCDVAKAGETIPDKLTQDLVPPTFRRQRQSSITSGGVPEVVDPSAGMPQSSFEDKRKENYEKGKAELDRRRKSLLEQQRKEQEERERKEREEADKLEKIRLEQERRRQAEIEKQMLRQREIEQEKEEQRKRAQDQREAARKEMERQRQLEWETQKSQELQGQRQKEQDILLKLKAKNQTLTIELGTLNDKVKELSQKICDTRVGVSGVKTTIDGMRATRDSQQQEMTALKNKLREQNQRLLTLSQEKARIEAKNKMNAAQDSAGQEAMRMAFANKQITLKQMKDKIEDLEKQITEKNQDIENNNGQLEEMREKMKTLASDCKGLYKSFDVKRGQILELRGAVTSGGVDYASAAWAESTWNDPVTAANDSWPVDTNEADIEPGIVKYRALYEFVARNDEEISFQPGDIILVPPVQNKEPGWMAGEIRGHTGWFPESYVEPVDGNEGSKFVQQDSVERKPLEEIAEVPENVSEAGSLGETQVPGDVGGREGKYYVALYQYSSTEPDDLSFNEGEIIEVTKDEGEWWSGIIGNRSGYFPSNYVEKCEPNINQVAQVTAAPVQATTPAPVQVSPTTEKTAEQIEDERQAAEDRAELPDFTAMASQQGRGRKPEIVQVLAPYQATSAEQLDLQRGQLIMIRKKTDSGWWEGELQARGKKRQIGWFPASYVKPLTSSSNRSTPVSHGYQDSPTDPNVERVMALYPHQAQNDDELSFDKGEVITVLAKQEEAWWKGELNGIIGIFPSNYVTPMSDCDYVISSVDPVELKRQDYIRELIATEEAYINDMRLVHEVFEKPLIQSMVLTVDEVERIFVNWRDIIACNDNFLRTLRIRRDNSEDGTVRMIGDILCENIPRMSAYVRFCSCQISAAVYLQRLTETCPEFVAIAQVCQQDPRTKGMPLSSFLIKPMQRITKYPLIISKILEYTPFEHPDRQYLTEALAKAEEFCTQVNEGVREKENSDRLEWLQTHITCCDSVLEEKLIFNSLTNSAGPRKLLHYGILHKAKSGKELVAFLTNDFLLFAQPLKALPTGQQFSFERNEKNKFKLYRKTIFLNELTMIGETEPNGNSNIIHTDANDNTSRILGLRDSTKKPILLLAPSTNECHLWVKKINEARKQFARNEKNLLQRQRSRQAQFGACGRILATVLQGSSIKTPAGKSNAFCKVSMGSQEERTPVVSGTDCPMWDTSMQFQIKDLNEDTLCITVFDKSYYTPDDFLGRAEVRIVDIMRDCKDSCGPIQKRIKLREVDNGEVVLKLDLQLFGS